MYSKYNRRMTDLQEEYNRLLNITQRKQKLDLINEFNDRVF